MQRKILILFFAIILVFFFVSSRSIVNVKIQELRFQLTKEQLLNFELSSKVLKEKIRQMRLDKDDYSKEIKMNILESNVMNAQIGASNTELTIGEKLGLAIVNFVRIVSGKSRLTLEEDQKDMMKIQFTFFLERTRKFATAVKKYDELETSITNKDSNEMGFVMLHNGFSTAMMGDVNLAISKLRKTEDKFSGTHFADNARILISVLLEGNKKNLDIANAYDNSNDRANAYYELGQYKETLVELDKIENRNSEQNYLHARSLEEVGQTSKAISEYLTLVEKKTDPEIAKKSNRRLLMIGSIYEKNKDLADYSKSNAEKLGDKEIIEKVEEGSKLILDSLIVEKLSKSESGGIDKDSAKEFEELKKELETIKLTEKEERKESTTKIEKEVAVIRQQEAQPKEEFDEPLNLKMKILFNDGRELLGKELIFEGDKIKIVSGIFSSEVPHTQIREIGIYNNLKLKNPPFRIELKNNKTFNAFKMVKEGDSFKMKLPKDEKNYDIEEIKQIKIISKPIN